ncbi:unnamed protein product [Schistosoma curassoni]|nr:unnamed protein product [Schistosoma curassoni]
MLAPQSHSGFYKTTVTKCFLAFSVIFSFILLMPFSKRKDIFTYNLDDIFENGSIWRLALCQLPFLSTKDLVCGGLLLYYFRIFERRYGSRKFLASFPWFILCFIILNAYLVIPILLCCNDNIRRTFDCFYFEEIKLFTSYTSFWTI